MNEIYSLDFKITNGKFHYSVTIGEDGRKYRSLWRINYLPLQSIEVRNLISIVTGNKTFSIHWS